MKIKSILNDFSKYKKGDYRELGLIVSYPYVRHAPTDADNNHVVIDNKLAMIGDKNEKILSKYNKSLKENKEVIFYGSDFEFDELEGIKPGLLFDKLIVKHCPVQNRCVSAKIDLDDIVK